MGKKKIVLDTNLYISALGWGGKPKEIINEVIEGKFELILSKNQLKEIKKVLNYPKFAFTKSQKQIFLKLLNQIATIIETKEKVKIVLDDPDDIIILEPVNEIDVDYIITGDNHLLKIKEFKGAKIIPASNFLNISNI